MPRATLCLCCLLWTACASVPPTRFGVRRVAIHGLSGLDPDALRACLTTHGRARLGGRLGVRQPGACGEPPFVVNAPAFTLWSWPWTPWPLFDRVALEQDALRTQRWLEARGFRDAQVTRVTVTPSVAQQQDTLDERSPDPGCRRRRRRQGCLVDVHIHVAQGPPTVVASVELRGTLNLPPETRAALRAVVALSPGARFDEALHDGTKRSLAARLAEHGYASARVRGEVRIDRARRAARVLYYVSAGPPGRFGSVRVTGQGNLPRAPILAAARIEPGSPYSPRVVEDARRAVVALGGLAAVEARVEPDADTGAVHVQLAVTPARRTRWSLGAGIQSGVLQRGDTQETISVPRWDVHLTGRLVRNNLLGGLRTLTLEARPTLLVQRPLPQLDTPRFANELRLEVKQPLPWEARTQTRAFATHLYGPDPFDTFFRHRLDAGIDLERFFFYGQRLYTGAGLRASLYRVAPGEHTASGSPLPANSMLLYWQQQLRVDLRDHPGRPHRGVLAKLVAQQAGYGLPSSWRYLRLLPELRVFLPLGPSVTLGMRYAVGALFIARAASSLDPLSRALGPRDFRLRGGGAASNRGYLPGQLGDGLEGGLRRWEASLELRVNLTPNLALTVFLDAGDVRQEARLRLDRPHPSAGGGLRYYTPVGPIRVDAGWQIRRWTPARDDDSKAMQNLWFSSRPGAVHISLGEAF